MQRDKTKAFRDKQIAQNPQEYANTLKTKTKNARILGSGIFKIESIRYSSANKSL